MIDAVTSATQAGRAAGDAASLAEDFDDFLTLLTTQLQNQDPLDPLDSNEFTQQLVSFTAVEQQIQTNQNLELLANLTRLQNVATAGSYLGSDALIQSDLGDHSGDGIIWRYENSVAAEELTLEVRDEQGTLVYSQSGEIGVGTHEFEWPGIDNAGLPVQPGNYQLEIVAENEDGARINPDIFVRETIRGVDNRGLEPLFSIGPNNVNQTEILELIFNG